MKKLAALLMLGRMLSGCAGGRPAAVETAAELPSVPETVTEAAPISKEPVTLTFVADNMDGVDFETGKKKLLDYDFQWVHVQIPFCFSKAI